MASCKSMHGATRAVGCEHAHLGHFCRMFPDLPAWSERLRLHDDPARVAEICRELGGQDGLMHDVDDGSPDSELPAAYTFFAQFVDHDITLDTGTELHGRPLAKEDVARLGNLRSAGLDLDCVYGFGPEASPHLYDPEQRGRLLVGNRDNRDHDLPRNEAGQALIGDPRNDENLFVSQLQFVFLRLHNRLLVGRPFEEAQRIAREHYHAVILWDFLARVCDRDTYRHVMENLDEYPCTHLHDDCGHLCMPVEFSVAAYRFGHTLVRSHYPVNERYPNIEIFDERFGTLGFRPVPPELVVDWRYLLDLEPCGFVHSKAFDTLLADELMRLPDPVVGRNARSADRALAFRNLLRGYVLGLPSGQDVARSLAELGYETARDAASLDLTRLPRWDTLSAQVQEAVTAHTPLFLFILAEAALHNEGKRLGPVGSAILLEVFLNLLKGCDSPVLEGWTPDPCIVPEPDPEHPARVRLADLVRYATG